MLSLYKGSLEKPTGNLIAFSYVRGENPLQNGDKLIILHISISFLAQDLNYFPVTIFPPLSVKDENELERMVSLTDYDVIRVDDIEFPLHLTEKEMEDFFQEKVDELNHYIVEYIDYCKEAINEKNEKLKKQSNKKRFIPIRLGTADGNLSEHRVIFPSRKMTEKQALDYIHNFFLSGENTSEENFKPAEIKNLMQNHYSDLSRSIRFLRDGYQKYDIQNFEKRLQTLLGEISIQSAKIYIKWYIKKFMAIFDENYEEAAILRNKISQADRIFAVTRSRKTKKKSKNVVKRKKGDSMPSGEKANKKTKQSRTSGNKINTKPKRTI